MWRKNIASALEIDTGLLEAFVATCERNHVDPRKIIATSLENYIKFFDRSDLANRLPTELEIAAERAVKKQGGPDYATR